MKPNRSERGFTGRTTPPRGWTAGRWYPRLGRMPDHQLLGTTWICDRIGTGRFHCPHCLEERDLERMALHRRVNLLGRPLFRMGARGEYVTCSHCGHAFAAAAVMGPDVDPEGVVSENTDALLALAAGVIFSDSSVRESEKEVAREVIRRYTGRPLTGTGVDDLLRRSRQRWGDPLARLARLRCMLPQPVRHRFVRAAYHICAADGELHAEESRFLTRVGEALDLGPREVHRSISEAKREARDWSTRPEDGPPPDPRHR